MATIQGKEHPDLAEQIDGAITVLHGRIGHPHGQEVAATVDQDVTLAAPDLFGSIVAARPARCHDLDRLAVNDPERRAGLAPLVLAHSHEQRVVQPRPSGGQRLRPRRVAHIGAAASSGDRM